MQVLYIAYSCSPFNGSEDAIGWNIPWVVSKYENVHVVTKSAHKKDIEQFLAENETNERNIAFHYVDIPKQGELFKGVAYSLKLNMWHRRAEKEVLEICKKSNIDIIHQITPVEFRSIGKYGKTKNCKFVVGPIGGAEKIPYGLRKYAITDMPVEIVRSSINVINKAKIKITKRLDDCDCLLFANQETKDFLINRFPICRTIGRRQTGLRSYEDDRADA